eukprot:gene14001-biopygen3564
MCAGKLIGWGGRQGAPPPHQRHAWVGPNPPRSILWSLFCAHCHIRGRILRVAKSGLGNWWSVKRTDYAGNMCADMFRHAPAYPWKLPWHSVVSQFPQLPRGTVPPGGAVRKADFVLLHLHVFLCFSAQRTPLPRRKSTSFVRALPLSNENVYRPPLSGARCGFARRGAPRKIPTFPTPPPDPPADLRPLSSGGGGGCCSTPARMSTRPTSSPLGPEHNTVVSHALKAVDPYVPFDRAWDRTAMSEAKKRFGNNFGTDLYRFLLGNWLAAKKQGGHTHSAKMYIICPIVVVLVATGGVFLAFVDCSFHRSSGSPRSPPLPPPGGRLMCLVHAHGPQQERPNTQPPRVTQEKRQRARPGRVPTRIEFDETDASRTCPQPFLPSGLPADAHHGSPGPRRWHPQCGGGGVT